MGQLLNTYTAGSQLINHTGNKMMVFPLSTKMAHMAIAISNTIQGDCSISVTSPTTTVCERSYQTGTL